MKRMLLLLVFILLVSSVASANFISIYSDGTGASCVLAPGFNPTVTVIDKFDIGSVRARFSMTTGANQIISYSSPYATVGNLASDITVEYGQCLTGSLVLVTAVMNLTGGFLYIHPAQGQTQVLTTDCALVNHKTQWGYAAIGNIYDPCNQQVTTEPSTWGSVKALYR
jgi:hypothetical protein